MNRIDIGHGADSGPPKVKQKMRQSLRGDGAHRQILAR